ncbi:hypothetical protein ISF6_2529 [Piscinibacter sakaiensis]|uniref:Uncharacterized protein n=1 Tax=Piscinibacter sakaiensis TaxID=1547922 RepID=A0A0K8P2D4_PISS1|nr:hypothetical protein ISF6_2529 [Piscinibacter sakaiensis]
MAQPVAAFDGPGLAGAWRDGPVFIGLPGRSAAAARGVVGR